MRWKGIVLMVIGCAVGFAAAFVVFHDRSSDVYDVPSSANEYGLVPRAESSAQRQIENTSLNSDGLFARINGRDRIISAAAIGPGAPSAGYHYAVTAHAVSPNKQFLYFCVRTAPEQDTCHGYVYHVLTDTVHYVMSDVDGAQIIVPAENSQYEWDLENRLSIADRRSVSADEPWLLD